MLISEVRAADPQSMIAFAGALTAANTSFDDSLSGMDRAVADTEAHWRGDASTAGSIRAVAERTAGTGVAKSVTNLVQAFADVGREFVEVRRVLLDLVDIAAPASGMTVADDGAVTAPRATLSNPATAAIVQKWIDSSAQWYESRIKGQLGLADALDMSGATLIRDALDDIATDEVVGKATPSPGLPGMPPLPPVDKGQAPHGSQPWYSRLDDVAVKELIEEAANGADAKGWSHAATNLRHYLGNSGEDFEMNPDELARDDERFATLVQQQVDQEVRSIATEAAASGAYGRPVQFQTTWDDHTVDPELEDWFYATGSLDYASSGVVTVHPPETQGGEPRVTVDYQNHVFDRYNWDGSKATEIMGFTVTDQQMGELHTAGLAQEYNLVGSTPVKHYDGTLPADGVLDLPSPPDNRDGNRDDLGRDTGAR